MSDLRTDPHVHVHEASIHIRLAGEPRGKGRARSRYVKLKGRPGFISTYSEPETANYESHLRLAAQRVMGSRALLTGPLVVRALAYFSVPASMTRGKRALALAGHMRPVKKPDGDNVLKLCDAFNKVVWVDDAQIVEASIAKFYSDAPRLEFIVEPWMPPPMAPLAATQAEARALLSVGAPA